MKHKHLRHMSEEVKEKKQLRVGCARDECAREKHLSAQRDHKVKGGSRRCGAAERHRPFFLRSGGTRLTSTRCLPPSIGTPFRRLPNRPGERHKQRAEASPFSHTKPEKHKDRFNTFRLIRQRDQRKSFRFFKKHKGPQSIKCSAVGQKLVVF